MQEAGVAGASSWAAVAAPRAACARPYNDPGMPLRKSSGITSVWSTREEFKGIALEPAEASRQRLCGSQAFGGRSQ